MKLTLSKLLMALALLLFSAQASAIIITDSMDIDEHVSWLETVSWTHNINDDGFVLGSAISGSLSIEFEDDSTSRRDGGEGSTIIIGIIDFLDGQLFYNPTSDWTGGLGVNSMAILNSTGSINVSVWSNWGDFRIGNSTLTVTALDNVVASVPEPATVLLMGAGLLGLGLVRLRQKS